MAPVSGAIFLRQAADFTNVCDKSARTAIHGNYGFASWHIAYKNESIALLNEKGAHWGDGLALLGQAADRGWNMGASHDFPLLRMANSQLAERSGCRADGPILQFQPVIDRRRRPPRQ
jgi:hypothetical protein